MSWRTVGVAIAISGGLLLFAGTLWVVDPSKLWAAVRGLALWQFGVFLLLSAVNFGLQVWRWDILLRAQDVRERFGRLVEIKLSAFAMTYLTPLADLMGEGVRAYLLHRNGTRMPLALASAAADKLIEWLVHVTLTLVILALAAVSGYLPLTSPRLLLVLGIIALLFFILGSRLAEGRGVIGPVVRLFHLERIRNLRRTLQGIGRFEDILADYLLTKRGALAKTIILSILITLITFTEVWLILRFLGLEPTLAETVIIQTMLVAVYATPNVATIGVGDFGGAATFQALELGAVSGVAFNFIVRAKDLIFAGLGLLSLFGFLKVDAAIVKSMIKPWSSPGSTS
ncbi:flippase-like domain-containing protein [Candidatus Parcubacteria bacterium]|nr:flippase-like domain-containing protein [Candidatus Parcubacteria bacterium]